MEFYVNKHAGRIKVGSDGRVSVDGVQGSQPITVLAREILAAAPGAAFTAPKAGGSGTYLDQLRRRLLAERQQQADEDADRRRRLNAFGKGDIR